MVDVERLRAETRGVEGLVHLDNAGAALMPAPVVDAVVEYLRREERDGGYRTARLLADELDDVYPALAELVGASPDELALADSATRAWGLVFGALRFEPGDRILTTRSEYASNVIAYLQVARRSGAIVEVVPDRPSGEVDPEALEEMLDHRVRLVTMNHMPTNSGLLNPVAEVGAVTRRHGVPFLVDACQTVGQVPLDVDELGCDFLSGTSRKFLRGPRGVGFLYVRRSALECLEPHLLDLQGAAWVARDRYEPRRDGRRFELWERSFAVQYGLAVAVRYALDVGVEAIWERIRHLAETLRGELAAIPGVEVHDPGRVRGGIVTFTVAGRASSAVREELERRRMNVSVSTVASARFDMEARGLDAVVRASPHAYNTEAELTRFCEVVGELAAQG